MMLGEEIDTPNLSIRGKQWIPRRIAPDLLQYGSLLGVEFKFFCLEYRICKKVSHLY